MLYFCAKFWREFFLLLYGFQNAFFSPLDFIKIFAKFLNLFYFHLAEVSCFIFSISRNKGNGAVLRKQLQNGTFFSTGNHPVETLLPMLHIHKAGFAIDVATLSGNHAKFEM